MPWLFILFVVVPAVEIYLLIQVGQLIGGIQTLGIVLATGLVGSYLAKSQGLAVWNKLSEKLSSGIPPSTELIDGAIILVSGTLLITPGILTDIVGLIGLLPFTRSIFRTAVSTLLKKNVQTVRFGMNQRTYQQGSPFEPGTPGAQNTDSAPNKSNVELSGSAKPRPSNS